MSALPPRPRNLGKGAATLACLTFACLSLVAASPRVAAAAEPPPFTTVEPAPGVPPSDTRPDETTPSPAGVASSAPDAPLPPPPPADPYAGLALAPEPPPAGEAKEPFYQKWWFWTAVGVFAVTTVVIVLASSAPGAPKTDLGNMPAF